MSLRWSFFLTAAMTFSVSHETSLQLPSLDFVVELMSEHSLSGLIFHVPRARRDIAPLLHYFKSSRLRSVAVVDAMTEDVAPPIVRSTSRSNKNLQLLLDFPGSSTYLARVFSEKGPSDTDVWLMEANAGDPDELKTMMGPVPLNLAKELFIYQRNGSHGNANLFEVYKIRPDNDAIVLRYGAWSERGGLDVSQEHIWKRRSNLQGILLQVATVQSAPYITRVGPPQNGSALTMDGMFAHVFHEIQDVLNFKYNLTTPPDGEWGADSGNGSWTGMVGMLQRRDIDIAVTDFTVTMERSTVMTFASPITQIYHTLFIRNPEGIPNYSAYTEPLHWRSWATIFLFVVVAPPVLFWTICYGPYDRNRLEFTLGKCYVFTASAMTFARGWSITPYTLKGQIAFGSLMVGGTLVYYHWEAMLISYLQTRVIVMPFHSLQELVSSTDFKIALTPGSSYADAYRLSPDPLWQNAWNTRIHPFIDTYPQPGHELVDKIIADSDYALYDNFFAISSYHEYSDCKIMAISKKYDVKPYAYGFQKDSPFLGPFNYYLKELREKGNIKQILDQYESRPQVCPDYSGHPLGFENSITAFMCLFFGLVGGLLLLSVEKCFETLGPLLGVKTTFIQSYGMLDREEYLHAERLIGDENAQQIIQAQKSIIQGLEQTVERLTSKIDPSMTPDILFQRRLHRTQPKTHNKCTVWMDDVTLKDRLKMILPLQLGVDVRGDDHMKILSFKFILS